MSEGDETNLRDLRVEFESIGSAFADAAQTFSRHELPPVSHLFERVEALRLRFRQIATKLGNSEMTTVDQLILSLREFELTKSLTEFFDNVEADGTDTELVIAAIRGRLMSAEVSELSVWSALQAIREFISAPAPIALDRMQALFQEILTTFDLQVALAAQSGKLRFRGHIAADPAKASEVHSSIDSAEDDKNVEAVSGLDIEAVRELGSLLPDFAPQWDTPKSDIYSILDERFGRVDDSLSAPFPLTSIVVQTKDPRSLGAPIPVSEITIYSQDLTAVDPEKIAESPITAAKTPAPSSEAISSEHRESEINLEDEDQNNPVSQDSIHFRDSSYSASHELVGVRDHTLFALALLTRFPSAAYQLSAASSRLVNTKSQAIPVWAFRLFALSPWSAAGAIFPNEQLREDFRQAHEAVEDIESYDVKALAPLVAAAAIGPAIVAPETAASSILRALPFPKQINSLLSSIATLADQLGGLDLSSLAPYASADTWNVKRNSLRVRAQAWREDAERRASSGLFVGARNVLRSWLRNDGLFAPHIEALWHGPDLPKHAGTLDEVIRLTRSDIGRKIDDVDSSTIGRNWIDGKARRVLVESAENAIEMLREWHSLINAQQNIATGVQHNLAKRLPELDEAFAESWPILSDLAQSNEPRVAASYSILECELRRLHDSLHGLPQERTSKSYFDSRPESIDEALGRDLLLTTLTLDSRWLPLQSSQEVTTVLAELSLDAELDIRKIVSAQLNRHDYLDAERLLLRIKRNDDDWATDVLADLKRLVEDARKPYAARVELAQRAVELSFRDNLLSETEREQHQERLGWLTTAFQKENFFSSILQLNTIEEEVRVRRELESKRLLKALDALSVSDAEPISRTRDAILNGQFAVAGEYLRRLEEDGNLPRGSTTRVDRFAEFFPNALRVLSNELKNASAPSDKIKQWVAEAERTSALGPFALLDRNADIAPILNAWFSRSQKPSLGERNVERIFRWLGFEVISVEQSESVSDSRRIFQVTTSPIGQRELISLAAFGSERHGRYTVVSHVNAETLIAEQAAIPSIHFLQAPLDERRRRELAVQARRKGLQFAVLDDYLLLHLARLPDSRMQAFFECTLPFTGIQPYTSTASIVPPEMFYGREKEIAKIIDPNGTCLIYGGRQLGKTALLLQVVKRYHSVKSGRGVYWIDLKNHIQSDPNALFVRITKELYDLGVLQSGRKSFSDKTADEILTWLEADDQRQLLFLLDEADDFLTLEQQANFKHVGTLKNLMERSAKRFKVVFAGLHNVVRFSKIPNHPLAHFGEPVNIGPLMGTEWGDALALIEQPMRTLGYEFEEEAALSILLQANYYPVLLQLWGRHLLDHCYGRSPSQILNGPPFRIDRETVDATYSGRKDLREQLREKFRFTLQLDDRYMVIAYGLRHISDESPERVANGVALQELLTLVSDVWPEGFEDMPLLDFRAYLDEMEGLGVLRPLPNDRYAFQNPTVPLLMGTSDDVVSVLIQPRSLATHDPNYFRKIINRDASPLTTLQLKEVFGKTSGAVIIVGSEALGLSRVVDFLRQEEHTDVILADACADKGQFAKFSPNAVQGDDRSIFVVAPADTPWNASWVEWAIERGNKSTAGRRRRWVFLANPLVTMQMDSDIERLERRGASVVRLERWRESAINSWMNAHNIALPQEKVDTLVQRSGGMPWLFDQFNFCAAREGTATKALESFSKLCESKGYSAGYLAATGLDIVTPDLKAVLLRLAEYGDACSVDDLADLSQDIVPLDDAGRLRIVEEALRWGQRMSLVITKPDGLYQARADLLIATS